MNKDSLKALARPLWRKLKLARLGLGLARAGLWDDRRYLKWSHGTDTDRTAVKRKHALYKAYHGVEKGLSLHNPRKNFGVPKMFALMHKIDEVQASDGDGAAAPAVSALRAYRRFNDDGDQTAEGIARWLDRQTGKDDDTGGTHAVTGDEIRAAGGVAGRDFFWTRHSVRQFSDTPVAMETIAEVVDMARKTPSVCNRQGPRVHVFENAQQALDHQPGNRGFGHLASRAFVVTADLQAFSGLGERNQAFVDGGMFAMSLLYALHAKGLGGCPLAWSTTPAHDTATRRALGIPENEVIIMMIAVGHLPDEFSVAKSHRMPLEDYMVAHTGAPEGDA
ncbi:MAG: nitroreductase family protein [Pseudomonadota bacterium]